MPESAVFSKSAGLVSLVISLVYRLTVRLTLEFLKIGALLTIVLGSTAAVCVGVVSVVVWVWSVYEGSLLAAVAAVALCVLMVLMAMVVVEFVVKDVLKLTDLPLVELLKILVSAVWKSNRNRKSSENERRSDQDLTSTGGPDQQVDQSN